MYHILPAKGQGQFGTTGRKLYTCFAARRKQPAVQLAPPILGGVGRMHQGPGTAGRDRVADPVGPGDERAAPRLKAQPAPHLPRRSEEPPVGKEGVRTCRTRWA